MSLSAIRPEGKLFLDGVEITPSVETPDVPTFDINKILYTTYKLEIPFEVGDVDKLKFKFLVSPGSLVSLTTESFTDGLGDILTEIEDEDLPAFLNGTDGYAGVITVSWAKVTNCAFFGRCSVMMVDATECSLWESSFMDIKTPGEPHNAFQGLYVLHSKIAHSKITPNTTVKFSRIINSDINNDTEGKGDSALAAEIEDSDINDCVIEGCGRTDVMACHLQECTFMHAGFMRITNQRLTGVEVKSDNIDLWSKFCFITVSLPYVTVYAFTTRSDEWHVYCEDIPERSFSFGTELDIFWSRVEKLLDGSVDETNKEEILRSCLSYLVNSVTSRMDLMKVIDSI